MCSAKPFFAKYENVRAGIRMLVFSGCGEETVSWGDSKNGGVMTASMNRAFKKCLTYREWWKAFKTDSAFKKVKQTPICTKVGAFDKSPQWDLQKGWPKDQPFFV